MQIQEIINELTDMSSKTDYLKYELHNALESGDALQAARYYNLINDAEETIVKLVEIVEDHSSLN